MQSQPADGTGTTTEVTAQDGGGNLPVVAIPSVAQSERDGMVYLLVRHEFSRGLKLLTWEVEDPSGRRIAHDFGHFSRQGLFYLKRDDGRQFAAGTYRLLFWLEDADGRVFSAAGQVQVGSLPGLPAGDLSGPAVAGFNRLAVRHLS